MFVARDRRRRRTDCRHKVPAPRTGHLRTEGHRFPKETIAAVPDPLSETSWKPQLEPVAKAKQPNEPRNLRTECPRPRGQQGATPPLVLLLRDRWQSNVAARCDWNGRSTSQILLSLTPTLRNLKEGVA